MASEKVTVACSNTVKREDRCQRCGDHLFYKINEQGHILEKFCGNIQCALAFTQPKVWAKPKEQSHE